jgi:hypothetical protein
VPQLSWGLYELAAVKHPAYEEFNFKLELVQLYCRPANALCGFLIIVL